MLNTKHIKVFLFAIIALPVVFLTARYALYTKITSHSVAKSTPVVVGTSTPPSQVNNVTPVVYPSVAAGNYSFSFTTKDGRKREYRVHVPLSYDSSKKYPVLFGFHGGFGTAEAFEKSTNLSALADERGYIAVYGQGLSFTLLQYAPVWNAGGCCGQAQADKENVDDVEYVRTVVEQIETKYNIDSSKIFATGMSNGGMFSNRLACEAADIFSGVAVVSGTIQVDLCTPSRRMPVLLIHGTEDQNVPYYGGKGEKAINQSTYIPVEQELRDWGNRNGCNNTIITTPVVVSTSSDKTVDKLTFTNCAVPVILYRVNGGAHEWPGAGLNNNPLEKASSSQVQDASRAILDFLGL